MIENSVTGFSRWPKLESHLLTSNQCSCETGPQLILIQYETCDECSTTPVLTGIAKAINIICVIDV